MKRKLPTQTVFVGPSAAVVGSTSETQEWPRRKRLRSTDSTRRYPSKRPSGRSVGRRVGTKEEESCPSVLGSVVVNICIFKLRHVCPSPSVKKIFYWRPVVSFRPLQLTLQVVLYTAISQLPLWPLNRRRRRRPVAVYNIFG